MRPRRSTWLIPVILLASACGPSAPATTTTTTLPSTTTSAAVPTTTSLPPTTTTLAPSTTTTTIPTTTTTTVPRVTTTTVPRVTTTTGSSAGPARSIWQVDTSRRVVALTFDAGSDRGYAEGILDLVGDSRIRVTFGMTGKWAESNPDLLRRMVDEGHILMNHTYDHPHMETLTTQQRLDQLRRTESIITGLTGASTKPYFRPPYGSYNDQVLVDVGRDGYRYSVMWTVDTLGWKGISPAEVVERCLNGAKPGAIILLHVGAASTDFDALPAIIDGLTDAGYEFATISELIP
jgi:peptidoglycan-N-acetylglucosamine deacetylase